MKQTWKALIYIVITALIYKFIMPFVPASLSWVHTLAWVFVLWGLGYLLSPTRKRNSGWVGKVVIALVMVFLVGLRLDLFVISEFQTLMNLVGLTRPFQDLLIVYCAWMFFQV